MSRFLIGSPVPFRETGLGGEVVTLLPVLDTEDGEHGTVTWRTQEDVVKLDTRAHRQAVEEEAAREEAAEAEAQTAAEVAKVEEEATLEAETAAAEAATVEAVPEETV